MESPKKNEHWHVQYGTDITTNIIVKIIENKTELNPPNWRKNKFKCDRLGKEIFIDGECFIERFD